MSLRSFIFLIADGAAAYWAYSIAHKPGGGVMYGAILFLAISAAAYHIAFNYVGSGPPGATSYERANVAMMAGFFFVFALGAAYLARQETRIPDIIAKWISMYPHITDISHAPPIDHDFLWDFMISSNDTTDQVGRFYQDPAHTRGWKVLDAEALHSDLPNTPNAYQFEFAKPKYHLFIHVMPGDFGKGAQISYRLEDKQNHL